MRLGMLVSVENSVNTGVWGLCTCPIGIEDGQSGLVDRQLPLILKAGPNPARQLATVKHLSPLSRCSSAITIEFLLTLPGLLYMMNLPLAYFESISRSSRSHEGRYYFKNICEASKIYLVLAIRMHAPGSRTISR